MFVVLFVGACTDELVVGEANSPANDDKGIGQIVLFSSGNANTQTTRADVCPYMEKEGRFVCKMYYHAKATDTDASPFDTVSTPITSWLRVNNNEGNSVYWQKDYDMDGVDEEHSDYKDYGFDSRAQYFYWRNRLNHVFLAYTDYNKLKTNTYNSPQGKPQQGSLFMYPERDGVKTTKTGELVSWPIAGFYTLNFTFVQVPNPDYSEDAKNEAIERGESYDVPEKLDQLVCGAPTYTTSYPGGGPYGTYLYRTTGVGPVARTVVEKAIYASPYMSDEDKTALKADLTRLTATTPEETVEGTFRNDCWMLAYDPEKLDPVTNCPDLTDPSTSIYCSREKKKIEDIIAVAPANTFDLTRGTKTSMAEQPDPLIALTKMKPTGATQEANRVRLHFKHQFSQIQVNLTNAENTAEITAERIKSVELLGVSEKGYVFTNINPDGTQIPPSYDPVIKSQYTEEQLKENEEGTSFNMFDMGTAKPATSLKSFNAIAFGQLKAIRITWQEEDYKDENGEVVEEGVKHVATYKITVDDRGNSLVNLKSGFRYMYDFELRRGTIAFIRATIDGWQLSDDLNYGTSGTINE